MENSFIEFLRGIKNSLVTRIFLIGFLILILLIPFSMIKNLVDERKERRDEVRREIFSKWALEQTINGPVLDIPYRIVKKGGAEEIGYGHFLPEKLEVSSTIVPEKKKRGLYRAVVYRAELEISGEFMAPDFSRLGVKPGLVLWEQGALNIGITDLRGISRPVEVSWKGEQIVAQPGISNKDLMISGVTVPASLNMKSIGDRLSFTIKLSLKGSSALYFLPLGRETKVEIDSSWQSPKFDGQQFLPIRSELDDKGFRAEWEIFDYNRNFPQQWLGNNWQARLAQTAFGVELYQGADEYQITTRAVKYAILFLFLTFLVCFLVIELINRKKIHPLQYLLVGFALSIFYILLLSISEHLDLRLAYLIAAVATVGLITFYMGSITGKRGITFLMCGFLSMLYLFLFVIIQLEEYALIMGSIGLFLILAAVMFFTRKIDLYSFKIDERKKSS